MRYSGQGWEIPVVLPYRTFSQADVSVIHAEFERQYRQLFGRIIDDLPIEITNWSLTVASVLARVPKAARHLNGRPMPAGRVREFYDAALRRTVCAQEVERHTLTPGVSVPGPAVIVESETSTIVTSGYTVTGQGDGSLLLQAKEART